MAAYPEAGIVEFTVRRRDNSNWMHDLFPRLTCIQDEWISASRRSGGLSTGTSLRGCRARPSHVKFSPSC